MAHNLQVGLSIDYSRSANVRLNHQSSTEFYELTNTLRIELLSSLVTLSGATSFKVRMSWVLANSCWHRRIRLTYFIVCRAACLSSMKSQQTVHNHASSRQQIPNKVPAIRSNCPHTHTHTNAKHSLLSCAWCYRHSNSQYYYSPEF